MTSQDSRRSEPGESRTFELPTGRLEIEVDHAHLPFDYLLGVASRQNRKRGFLFRSNVLGKHLAARPVTIRDIHARLAKLMPDMEGPVLFIGMAETAILLGHGVFDEWVKTTGRTDAMFIHTTRYNTGRPTVLTFKEDHSHAAEHLIYQPKDVAAYQLMRNARTIVLIDDEASTGATFHNLLEEIKHVLPNIRQAVTVVITDWRGVLRGHSNNEKMPIPTVPIALLNGQYSFEPAPDLQSVSSPNAVGNGRNKSLFLRTNFGREGLMAGDICVPVTGQWQALAREIGFGLEKRNRVLVLGTGEFAYPPFLLAEFLESRGVDVFYQSTTRSPIMAGSAIEHKLIFMDNYEDGINNYLYNAKRDDYEHVFVCIETPACTLDEVLLEELKATTVRFAG
ncbi:MAG: phosphoribosyltransferase family protein [Candidatus Obscuribacterales bacterium]|nr:phosphoribosyltransferase family protein [Candidatus Obscuribacterales bacterium]